MSQTDPQFPIDKIYETVCELHETQPFVTSGDVADAVGSVRETARIKLNQLVEEGKLNSRKVGGRAKVWYAPQITGRISVPESSSATSQSAEPSETDSSERIMFFPSRREIAVDAPSDETQSTLAQTAHLVDSTGEGYLYKIDEADVWNAPYDSFEALRDDLRAVVGADNWDGGFESRLRDDWERAHQFRLRTHDQGYSVLEAVDADVFENVAKRHLEYGDHYTEYLSDTELRVTKGGEAGVKETLYDVGYPVIDERRLEEGSSLDIQLADDIILRDYQQEWIDQFSARHSGVFVGPSGSGKTIAALGVMGVIGGETLIIVPNRELAQQWEDELLEKTTLTRHQIGQYHGGTKQIRHVRYCRDESSSRALQRTRVGSRHRRRVPPLCCFDLETFPRNPVESTSWFVCYPRPRGR
jgi:DNA excision repair protein ERCC-3